MAASYPPQMKSKSFNKVLEFIKSNVI